MLAHTKLLACLLPFFLAIIPPKQSSYLTRETRRWVISQSSTLCVNGSTNINQFACEIPGYDHSDTLIVTTDKSERQVKLSGCVKLKIQSFDCHNSIMTHDLRSTLKE